MALAVNEKPVLLADPESQKLVGEDVEVIRSSLHSISDLLRTMRDFHRADHNQLAMALRSTDLRIDVNEPVATMLYRRDAN